MWQIDDPLDAIAVHAGGGMWGMLACAAFAAPNMVTDWYGPHPDSTLEQPVQVGQGRRLRFVFCWYGGRLRPKRHAAGRQAVWRGTRRACC